jgi:hypothetical protein
MNAQITLFKNVFGECKYLNTSPCLQKTSYQTTTSPLFGIFDEKDEAPVLVVDINNEHQLKVKNPANGAVCIIKTDKCLFTDETKKCDCILFNNNKLFFVEIKDSNNKSVARRKAAEQLGVSIELLVQNNIDLTQYETKAIICFKSGATRPTQPSLNTKRAIFLETYNISLEEGNLIEF